MPDRSGQVPKGTGATVSSLSADGKTLTASGSSTYTLTKIVPEEPQEPVESEPETPTEPEEEKTPVRTDDPALILVNPWHYIPDGYEPDLETVQGKSPRTTDEYYLDLRLFLRFHYRRELLL